MRLFARLVELYLGPVAGWVDITADVRGGVSIRSTGPGRRQATLTLANNAGDYSPRNPAGRWYGLLGRNTPIRVSAGRLAGPLVARLAGEVSEWPPKWTLNGRERWVTVTAAGPLRRLGQGEQPEWSPLRRTIAGSGPVAYWPAEDGNDASMAGSAVGGHPPLEIAGTATFADIATWTEGQGYTVRYGSAALVDIAAGASLSAVVLDPTVTAAAGGWTVAVASDVAESGLSGDLVLLEVETPGGTFGWWRYVLTTTGRTQIIAGNGGVSTVVVDDPSQAISMFPHNFAVWQSSPGVITAGFSWDSVAGFEATATVAGTVAGVARLTVNPTRVTAATPIPTGHMAVWSGHSLDVVDLRDGAMISGLFGWEWSGIATAAAAPIGEPSTDRLARLCDEAGIPFAFAGAAGAPGSQDYMGRQLTAKFGDLVDECTDVDGGLLYESRGVLGLAYRPRASLYNQAPVPIAYVGQLAPPFDPVDDADRIRNDVTVKRTGGSSARTVQRSGPLAALPPPVGVGVYITSPEINVASDAVLPDHAGWRLHVGTVDRPRYPALSLQLAAPEWQAAPAAIDALLAVDVGGVLEVTGLPTWAAGDARTIVTGYGEEITDHTWSISYEGDPAQPWDVAEVGGESRPGLAGGTLAAPVTAAGTVLQLASTSEGGLWTTVPADFPLDLRVGEERVRVSSIAGAASPQTATVAPGGRGVNGVVAAWPAGTVVDVWRPAVVAL